MTEAVRLAVLNVYAEVDRAVAAAGPRCDASGRCCRFEGYGHTLFISHFEAELLLETAPHYEQPAARAACPFQVQGLCTARNERPLGCRIYFCDPSYQETGNLITEDSLTQLKRIADEHDTGWRYAPLHVFLNESVRPVKPESDTMTPARVSLPVV